MSELKPCPFCGGDAILCKNLMPNGDDSYETIHVECQVCRSKTDSYFRYTFKGPKDVYEAAIDAWNRRV